MKIPKKYQKSITVKNALFESNMPSNEKLVSCGILEKGEGIIASQYDLQIDFYSGVYILKGNGLYVNKSDNKTYLIYPGCFIQRIPGIAFDTIVDEDSEWLEFFINLNENIFNTAADLGIFSRDPVLYIGERYYIFDELLNHMEEYKMKESSDYPSLMFEACSILFQINQINKHQGENSSMLDILNHLNFHLNVGENLTDIVSSLGLNYEKLRKQFKNKFNMSLSSYIIKKRIEVAKKMIVQNFSIKEIALHFNYCDEFAFIKQFKKNVGMTPNQYRAYIEEQNTHQTDEE